MKIFKDVESTATSLPSVEITSNIIIVRDNVRASEREGCSYISDEYWLTPEEYAASKNLTDFSNLIAIIDTYKEKETIKLEKEKKIKELEVWYVALTENGFEYAGKHFKADSEAYENFIGTAILMSNATLAASVLPLTWYTRNGEEGTVEFTTADEVMRFIATGGIVCKNLKDKYYSIKKTIENCESLEDLSNIKFN